MEWREQLTKPADIWKITSIWMKSVFSTIKRFTFDSAWQLRVAITSAITIGSGTITIVSQSNTAMGNQWLNSTTITTSNSNFQSGWRRLIRKI